MEYIILFFGILVITFFGTVSGGMGLLTRPLISFLAGIPIDSAIATSRVSNLAGSKTFSLLAMRKHSGIDWSVVYTYGVTAGLSGALGSWVVLQLDNEYILKGIGFIAIASAVWMTVQSRITVVPRELSGQMREMCMHVIVGLTNFIGSTSGGGGIVSTIGFLLVRRDSFTHTVAHRKLVSVIGAVISAGIFIAAGLVDWSVFGVIVVASMIGSWTGTRFALHRGERYVRILTLGALYIVGLYYLLF